MELYITTFIIMLASLSGVIFLVKGFSGWLEKNSKFIIAFSAGIFTVIGFNLVFESFEFGSNLFIPILSVLVGFGFFQIIEKKFPEIHHHDAEHDPVCLHSKRKVIWGDALHNVGDGILLAIAFSVDIRVGLVAALGIFVHEFVQEINEFAILRLSGFSVKKALIINFLISLTIIPGVFIGTYLSNQSSILAIIFGLAAGAFIHLVWSDLIPHSIQNSKKDRRYFMYALLIVAGMLTIVGVNKIGGGHETLHPHDSHEEAEHHDEHDDEHEDENEEVHHD